MDEQRIQKIRERLQATTPGAWEVCFAEGEKFDPECPKRDPSIFSENDQFVAQTTYDTLSETCRPTMYADAVFIAHAKEDISYLLEQLEIFFSK